MCCQGVNPLIHDPPLRAFDSAHVEDDGSLAGSLLCLEAFVVSRWDQWTGDYWVDGGGAGLDLTKTTTDE